MINRHDGAADRRRHEYDRLRETLDAIREAVRKPNRPITNEWYWSAVSEVQRLASDTGNALPRAAESDSTDTA